MYDKFVTLDAHCDSIKEMLDDGRNITDTNYSFNLEDAKEILPHIQFMAAFVNPIFSKKGNGGFVRVNKIIDKFYEEYTKHIDNIIQITCKEDIDKVVKYNKLGVLLTVENGSAIGNDIYNIERLYNRKVRMMTLTWNEDNKISSGAYTKNDLGLSEFGKKCIKKMEELKMIIDLSHISEKGFYDVLENSNSRVVASHSCVKNICYNNRNLTDSQIKEIAKRKGVIGVCFYSGFLSDNGRANINDVINNIEYIANLVGTDYIGIGSDFDGVKKSELPLDIQNVKDIIKIKDKLEKHGFSNDEIQKIMGGNFINLLKESL